MNEIKRIRLKDDDVIQVGDVRVENYGGADGIERHPIKPNEACIGEHAKHWIDGSYEWYERDLRPLAKGEVIREGDYTIDLTRGDVVFLPADAFACGKPADGVLGGVYRPVRMQSEGWRYLDEGEIKPKGYGFFAVTGKWIDWPRADNDGTIVGDEGLRYRAPWPPREEPQANAGWGEAKSLNQAMRDRGLDPCNPADRVKYWNTTKDLNMKEPLELTDNSSKPFAIAETCIGTLPLTLNGGRIDLSSWKLTNKQRKEMGFTPREGPPYQATPEEAKRRSCVYCDEPDDETCARLDDGGIAHAKCAMDASNLKPPGPVTVSIQIQHEDFV